MARINSSSHVHGKSANSNYDHKKTQKAAKYQQSQSLKDRNVTQQPMDANAQIQLLLFFRTLANSN